MELISKFHVTKREKILIILLIMTLIFGISQYISSKQSELPPFKEQPNQDTMVAPKKDTEGTKNEQNQEIVVDVKGAVVRPGIYHLKIGDRLLDAVQSAGGALDNADMNQVNLAMKLSDEMVVYIPKQGEVNGQLNQTTMTQNRTSNGNVATANKMNINTANETELMELEGIGETKAKAIIQYREKNGSFQKIEDVMNVTGIGVKTFEKFKEKISVH